MLDGMKFGIACEGCPRQTTGGGHAKGIRIGNRMLALDLHCHQLDGKLLQKMKGLGGLSGPGPALHDVEEFAPVDSVQKGLSLGSLLLVESGLDLLPAELLMKQADQCKTIDDELFAHGAPPPGAPVGDRLSRRTVR